MACETRLKIAVVGTGISGLSAAWLLSQKHDVTVYERAGRIGGHANTVRICLDGRAIVVDTGFIVFNRRTYPNLTALFNLLKVPTQMSDMSLAVSLNDGALEYSGSGLRGVFGQPLNLVRPQFWSMLADLRRFYHEASRDAGKIEDDGMSLGDYLVRGAYGATFRDHHILPMASAIWSAEPAEILSFPAASFIRFHANHGLLQISRRPVWETVTGGSQTYVDLLTRPFADKIRLKMPVVSVTRTPQGPDVCDATGHCEKFDHVVFAGHADETLGLLADASDDERRLLGAFRYSRNLAVLHTDARLMPRRRTVWSSWNFIGDTRRAGICVTYWMNRLQNLATNRQVFVTLNPPRLPHAESTLHVEAYDHPIFDLAAGAAQRKLWRLQGLRNSWFCGAYFGAGFHEDGLQAGLAVAEQLGGLRRPWTVADESGRIHLGAQRSLAPGEELVP